MQAEHAGAFPAHGASLPVMPRSTVLLFACASGLSVANVYYAQPLLDALATAFSLPLATIGGVVTATQVGCALALMLLVPLGDLLERRRLMLVQALMLTAVLVLLGLARTPAMLFASMLLTGALGTAMTQGLIAYAASAATENERGRVVGAAQGGVFLGLLLARVLAGGISDMAGWRSVYFCSAVAMLVLAVLLWSRLPRIAIPLRRMSYLRLIGSMFQLLQHNRVLQIRGVLALLMFAAFNIFWSALVLPLSAPPYAFSHTAIGAFGLVGAAGALAAARAGRWADQGFEKSATLAALVLLLVAWLPLSLLPTSLTGLVIGIVLLDLGGQAIHVTNQSLIFRSHPEGHSRLVGAYMLFYAVGSGMGALSTTAVYAATGWLGVCLLGFAVSLLALVFWAATLPYMKVATSAN
ncbi:MFS transporter [Noviherbaspirillum sp.]|uniref:MFS transporter n=1 Tax=Noviherbaspirillum sp. TaxID=1926288 RepID=UPI0039C8E475